MLLTFEIACGYIKKRSPLDKGLLLYWCSMCMKNFRRPAPLSIFCDEQVATTVVVSTDPVSD